MKRPHADPAPADPDTARVVIDYAGVQVIDSREHIRTRVMSALPAGLKAGLRAGGFKPRAETNDTWERPHTPAAIVEAQAIVSVFFPKNGD